MTRRLLNHARANAIAYLALGVSMLALAGGAYAAISLPPGSVGGRQIRPGAIDPSKLDRNSITGYVRHWAEIKVPGRLIAASRGAHVTGTAGLFWNQSGPVRHCIALSSALNTQITSTRFDQTAKRAFVDVATAAPVPGRVSIAVIC